MPAWFDVGVLTVVTGALFALVVHRVVRVIDPRGSRRAAVVLLVLATALFGWALGFEVRHQRAQASATAVTRELTGNPDAVAVCQRLSPDLLDVTQNAGHVTWDQPEVSHLRRATCHAFFSWLVSDKTDPSFDQVEAVHVVVHEAMHVAGQYDEGIAECWAMQRDAEAAALLGADPDDARALAAAYYREHFPFMRSEYRAGGCTDGGELDLTPGDGAFP
jgi:hypothetical protein